MTKNKLIFNAKKTDSFLRNYLNKEQKSSLIHPMKYGVLSGGKKNKIFNNNKHWKII